VIKYLIASLYTLVLRLFIEQVLLYNAVFKKN
jgi:hypothetical protein